MVSIFKALNCLQVQMYQQDISQCFLLCPTAARSTNQCQVQCGNDKHPLYPSSEVPAVLSHKRDSHILASDGALMSRIDLEKDKANVSSGHVNMANSARRLTRKERNEKPADRRWE